MYEKHVSLRASLGTAALWGAVLSASFALAACGSKSRQKAELTVTSFAPDGASYDPTPSIQLQFDAPVVAEEQVGAKLDDVPLALEPDIDLEAHWLDRQTLVAVPTAELAPSTRYNVKLRGPLASRTGDFTFAFISMPLSITGVGGDTLDRLPPTPRLALQLNQKVAASAVIEHCRLRAPDSKDGISLTTADPKLEETSIVVSPKTPLTQGSDYELVCEGLTGVGGNAPLAEPFVQAVHTYAAFTITEILPSGDSVPADDVAIEIGFANPVTLEDVREHVSMEPKTPGVAEGWLDGDGMRYRVTLNLETTTPYKLRIAQGLKDMHGQVLPAAVEHSFTTSDARPRISMETGIYALETVATGYPVWSRNVSTFDVECARVATGAVTKVLTTPIDYSGWSDSEESIDWKKLGLKQKVETVKIENAKNKWHIDHLDLGKMCGPGSGTRGMYLAQLRSEDIVPDPNQSWAYRPYQRVLANVTNLGLLLKVGDGSGVLWVTQLSDGQPVSGARVTTYTKDGKRTFQGTTGADGLVRLPGRTQLLPPAKKKSDEEAGEYGYYGYGGYGANAERVIAVVETTDDMAVVDGNWSDGIEAWNFNVTQTRSGENTGIRGFIQSDRGIYRPGETVHFKGLVREVAVGKPPAVPQQKTIKVAVESSRGSTLLEKNLTLSSFGGFHFDLPLTVDAPVGDYHVKASLGAQTFRESFSVEEFRAVTFEVEAKVAKRHTRLREPLQVDVSARYLFGEPVSGGKVEWSVERRTHQLSIPDRPGFAFSDYAASGNDYWWYRSSEESATSVGSGKGVTDKQGKTRLTINDNDITDTVTDPQDYLIEITVKDPTDQAVQKSVVVTGHRPDHYLGLRATEYVGKVDEPMQIEVVAVTPTGEPVAAKATLSAIRSSWECKYEAAGYRSYPRCERKETLATSREISIPASGPKTEGLRVDKPGSYVLRLEGTDARGNKIASSTYAWVTGSGDFGWSDNEESRMNLIASKPSYEPGETARLVPQSSLQGALALVTVERGGILEARVQRVASASDGIEVALSDVHAPNVFASVALVRGRTGPKDEQRPRLQLGMTELKVSSAARRLAVNIETDKESYQPGETVRG
ncbi:MAG TPA: MG2 domain-containing protein, partial [Haliangium sp.]|nr:MG2 domain-containing protein [Haliangium sp.]